jgi:hypothetical protein
MTRRLWSSHPWTHRASRQPTFHNRPHPRRVAIQVLAFSAIDSAPTATQHPASRNFRAPKIPDTHADSVSAWSAPSPRPAQAPASASAARFSQRLQSDRRESEKHPDTAPQRRHAPICAASRHVEVRLMDVLEAERPAGPPVASPGSPTVRDGQQQCGWLCWRLRIVRLPREHGGTTFEATVTRVKRCAVGDWPGPRYCRTCASVEIVGDLPHGSR